MAREIQALPKHIQEFRTDPKYRRAVNKKDYERALRIGKTRETEGISPDELYEYMKAAGEARSYSEKDIDAFLSGRPIKQAERKHPPSSGRRLKSDCSATRPSISVYCDLL